MTARQAVLFALAGAAAACGRPAPEAELDAEAIIVGAGISGLSAAVEIGRSGANVMVVDMNSVPGGHAVLAGGFAIVGTPAQQAAGIKDSPDLAYRDWVEWTEDGDPEWTRYYAENSREMIYDWLTVMGAEFVRVQPTYDNSVPRFHFTQRGAFDVVLTLFRTAVGLPNISFLWNHRVEDLVLEEGRVRGVEVLDLRSGNKRALTAANVVLATGGFEADLERVLANWMPDLPKPDRLLIGSSIHAQGQGLDLATEAGASLTDLSRQYIYVNGIVNLRDPAGNLAITAGNDSAMWVNAQGERFTNETGWDKTILVDLLDQDPSSYWAIFDETARDDFSMRGAEWVKNPMAAHPILDDPEATSKASTLEALAESAGLPADALVASVQKFNAMIDAGEDTEFARFASKEDAPPKIRQPPFYAVQFFPMTRKSMGGVAIDMQGRVLDEHGQAIPGLYAAGELTGSVGINGKHGMDGMFLGPAVFTGHLVGRTIAAAHQSGPDALPTKAPLADDPLPDPLSWEASVTADQLRALLIARRNGYWHFQMSHEMVLEREYACTRCHSAEMPFAFVNNRASKLAQTEVCANCHGR